MSNFSTALAAAAGVTPNTGAPVTATPAPTATPTPTPAPTHVATTTPPVNTPTSATPAPTPSIAEQLGVDTSSADAQPGTTATGTTEQPPVTDQPLAAVDELPTITGEVPQDVDPNALLENVTPNATSQADESDPDIDISKINAKSEYKIKGARFLNFHADYSAARELRNSMGIDIRQPEGRQRIADMQDTIRAQDALLQSLESPTEVPKFADYLLESDKTGESSLAFVDHLFSKAPEAAAQYHSKIAPSILQDQLARILAGAANDQRADDIRNAVEWIAHKSGLDINAVRAHKPAPTPTPEVLELQRARRELEAAKAEAAAVKAEQTRAQIKSGVTTTVNNMIANYLQTTVPKISDPAFAKIRQSVIMKLSGVVSEGFRTNTEFKSQVEGLLKTGNPQQVVDAHKRLVEQLLNPTDRRSKAFQAVATTIREFSNSAGTATKTRESSAEAAAAVKPVVASGGAGATPTTQVIKPEVAIKPGENGREAFNRVLQSFKGA